MFVLNGLHNLASSLQHAFQIDKQIVRVFFFFKLMTPIETQIYL